jgi:hypothetical protein
VAYASSCRRRGETERSEKSFDNATISKASFTCLPNARSATAAVTATPGIRHETTHTDSGRDRQKHRRYDRKAQSLQTSNNIWPVRVGARTARYTHAPCETRRSRATGASPQRPRTAPTCDSSHARVKHQVLRWSSIRSVDQHARCSSRANVPLVNLTRGRNAFRYCALCINMSRDQGHRVAGLHVISELQSCVQVTDRVAASEVTDLRRQSFACSHGARARALSAERVHATPHSS